MSGLLDAVLADLDAESAVARHRLVGLTDDDRGWRRTTPAPGWTVAHQVAHLTWTDEVAVLAARAAAGDTGGEEEWDAVVLAALDDPDGFVDASAARLADAPAGDVLARWDAGRRALADALRAVPEGARLPWFGPPMSPASMATARFMETWAHAHDVAEGLAGADGADSSGGPDGVGGAAYEPSDRIRHVAHLGVRTRGFAFAAHGLEVPDAEVRVELTAPSGERWTWGPADAADTVIGPAYDFCLRVTQRRPRSALALVATGPVADAWLDVAQCFAGPPGAGSGARDGTARG